MPAWFGIGATGSSAVRPSAARSARRPSPGPRVVARGPPSAAGRERESRRPSSLSGSCARLCGPRGRNGRNERSRIATRSSRGPSGLRGPCQRSRIALRSIGATVTRAGCHLVKSRHTPRTARSRAGGNPGGRPARFLGPRFRGDERENSTLIHRVLAVSTSVIAGLVPAIHDQRRCLDRRRRWSWMPANQVIGHDKSRAQA